MPLDHVDFLLSLCHALHSAQQEAEKERKRELFGDTFPIELLVTRFDKVRITIYRETVRHNEPHMHIVHSDQIDASVSLIDFRVLAGHIDGRTMKHVASRLYPLRGKLMQIWATLNEDNNSIAAERLINSLFS